MTTTIDDSLMLGLRTLATLAREGPRDALGLAGLHGSRLQHVEAVLAELERGGLVHRMTDQELFGVTCRGASLFRNPLARSH